MNDKTQQYETLVRAFHSDVYRYAVWLIKDPTIAEDVVQETFMRAWKSLDSLQDPKAAKAWLITILRRENARRFERKQFDTVDMDDVPLVDATAQNDGAPEQQALHRAINQLTDEYKEPLLLQSMFGYSGEEIAQMLDLNKNTVMTRLFRARNQLKTLLTDMQSPRGQANG
jgi:RNA polymerase sigma-70 factor (ECF subfamily)